MMPALVESSHTWALQCLHLSTSFWADPLPMQKVCIIRKAVFTVGKSVINMLFPHKGPLPVVRWRTSRSPTGSLQGS